MFGIIEAVYSFILRQIGLRTDGADAGGSIHSKLAHISNKIGNYRTVTTIVNQFQQMRTLDPEVLVLSVTGKGFMNFRATSSSSYECSSSMRLVIDGVEVFNKAVTQTNEWSYDLGTLYFTTSVSVYIALSSCYGCGGNCAHAIYTAVITKEL